MGFSAAFSSGYKIALFPGPTLSISMFHAYIEKIRKPGDKAKVEVCYAKSIVLERAIILWTIKVRFMDTCSYVCPKLALCLCQMILHRK